MGETFNFEFSPDTSIGDILLDKFDLYHDIILEGEILYHRTMIADLESRELSLIRSSPEVIEVQIPRDGSIQFEMNEKSFQIASRGDFWNDFILVDRSNWNFI